MKFGMTPAPFQRSKRTTTQIMLELTVALLVIVAVAIGFQFTVSSDHGIAAILIILTSVLVTLALDVIVGLLQKEKNLINYVIKNYSYVTAIIYALCLPVGTHLYIVAAGALFATLVGKAVFGGFGKSIGNPAIIGRIFVSIAFGSRVTGLVKDVAGKITTGATVTTDWAGATKWLSSDLGNMKLFDILLGNYQGALGETFTLLILALGVILVIRKVIDYRQPAFYLGTVLVASLFIALVNGYEVGNYLVLQLGLGGLAFGAIFMLTDPVTTPTSPLGKIISSIIGGFMVVLIRVKAGAVEGVMYSILLINVLTPVIDGFIAGTTTKKLGKQYAVAGGFFVGAILLSVVGCYRPKPEPVPPPPAPIIDTITISPNTIEVEQGKTQSFTAVVTGQNDPDLTVTWSITGTTNTNTKISDSGRLSVASDEVATTLTVKATSNQDNTKSASATVTVKEKQGSSTTITVDKSKSYTFGSINVYFEVDSATQVVSGFELKFTGAEAWNFADESPAFGTQYASATAINGKTLTQVETLITGAGTATGVTESGSTYKALMLEAIAFAKTEISKVPSESSSISVDKSKSYTFGSINVYFEVDSATQVVSGFELKFTGAEAWNFADESPAFSTQYASATAINGKTLAQVETLITGAGTATGVTESGSTYKALMLEAIADAKAQL